MPLLNFTQLLLNVDQWGQIVRIWKKNQKCGFLCKIIWFFQFGQLIPKGVLDKKRKLKCVSGMLLTSKPSFCHLTCVQYERLEAGKAIRNLFQKYKPKAEPVSNKKKGDVWLSEYRI